MTSSTEPTCDPEFPARRVLVDNSALVRLYKCDLLAAYRTGPALVVADQVAREFRKQGPSERALLSSLGLHVVAVRLGTAAWAHFGRLRGDRASTRELGEDESIAIALAAADGGECLPFVTYDAGAGRRAAAEGLLTLDFLDSLAWLVGCGVVEPPEADLVESRARFLDGWRPPAGYPGTIEGVRAVRQDRLVGAAQGWTVRGR